VETKLIELYLLICRLYNTKPVLKQQRLSNNHEPLFSDEELLTMYLFGHLQGLTTQRRIYDYIRHHWRAWFPALPSYQSVNGRLNALAPAFELLIEQLLLSGRRRRLKSLRRFLSVARLQFVFAAFVYA
jgi:hypothetical protein